VGVASPKNKGLYSLNELARSGILQWTDRATVRKYVEAYPDIFEPRVQGEGKSKRYVIYRKDAEKFMSMLRAGKIKDFRSVRAGQSRAYNEFISIVSADGTDKGKKLRDIAEELFLRVDLLPPANTRRLFMEALGNTKKTHRVLVLVISISKGKIKFTDSTTVNSTDIRRIQYPKGVLNKEMLLWTDNPLNRPMERAFSDLTSSLLQVVGDTSSNTKEFSSWLVRMKENNRTWSNPSHIHRLKSATRGRTRMLVRNASVKQQRKR